MAADREARVLDDREQRVVALVVVVGQVDLGREHRELQRLRAEPHDAVHLLHRRVDVVDRDLVRDDQTARVGGAELAESLVERDRGLRLAHLQVADVAERADLAVDDLLLHAVGVHVGEAGDAVGVAGPGHVAEPERARRLLPLAVRLPGLVHPAGALRHPLLEGAHRAVVLVVELGRQVGLHRVVAHLGVRVGGDEELGHGDGPFDGGAITIVITRERRHRTLRSTAGSCGR